MRLAPKPLSRCPLRAVRFPQNSLEALACHNIYIVSRRACEDPVSLCRAGRGRDLDCPDGEVFAGRNRPW